MIQAYHSSPWVVEMGDQNFQATCTTQENSVKNLTEPGRRVCTLYS